MLLDCIKFILYSLVKMILLPNGLFFFLSKSNEGGLK